MLVSNVSVVLEWNYKIVQTLQNKHIFDKISIRAMKNNTFIAHQSTKRSSRIIDKYTREWGIIYG